MTFETKDQLLTHTKKYCHVNNFLHESKLSPENNFDVDAFVARTIDNIKHSRVKTQRVKTPRDFKAKMFIVDTEEQGRPLKRSQKGERKFLRRGDTVKRALKASRVLLIEEEGQGKPPNKEEVLVVSRYKGGPRNDDSLSFDKLKMQNNKNISVMQDYINHTKKKLDYLRKSKAEELDSVGRVY